MAWTAAFINYNAADNKVNIDFSDGVRVEHASFTPPNGLTSLADAVVWIKTVARDVIGKLITRDTLVSAPPDTDVTPDAIVSDPDQSLLDQWTSAVNDLRQSNKAVALGIYDKTSPFYTTPFNAMMAIWNGSTTAQKTKGIGLL